MCYNVANAKENKELAPRYNKKMDAIAKAQRQIAFMLNGFAHPNLCIIKSETPDALSVGKWGLVPADITNEVRAEQFAKHTLNAKSETIFDLPSFKDSIIPKRCLIPVTGFFEWRTVNKNKYPYYIYLKKEEIFSLGGIYSDWTNEDTGAIQTTFSIITTSANPLMAKIHNLKERMPLIFDRETENKWIEPKLTVNEIKGMMKPFDDVLMNAHTIKKQNPKDKDLYTDKVIKPFEYPELTLMENFYED
jgi:putative SOS response-associated peptidase YedK